MIIKGQVNTPNNELATTQMNSVKNAYSVSVPNVAKTLEYPPPSLKPSHDPVGFLFSGNCHYDIPLN